MTNESFSTDEAAALRQNHVVRRLVPTVPCVHERASIRILDVRVRIKPRHNRRAMFVGRCAATIQCDETLPILNSATAELKAKTFDLINELI